MIHKNLSKISLYHIYKLVFRFILFMVVTLVYVFKNINGTSTGLLSFSYQPVIYLSVWLIFVVEMIFRFFPSKIESMGCQKQFAINYSPSQTPLKENSKSYLVVALVWILLNAIIGILYYAGIIDQVMLLIISLAFSVCDMICILFFCPFQTWIMKNRCCVSCRIYNWDYAMMFTPLVFIKSFYTWSILIFAIALLLRWEIACLIYPERFSDKTNKCLSCANCTEKLCKHKIQLQQFLKNNKERIKGE